VVSDATLLETLLMPDPQQAVDRMIELALRGGGPDNITCIVAEVLDEPAGGSAEVVVAGAASEYTPIALPRPDTPAARASLMTAPAKPQREAIRSYAAAHATRKKRRPLRLVLFLVIVIAAVAGLAFAGRAYVHRQYYVGVHNEQVVIYRGVPDSFAGVKLSSVKTNTGIAVSSLKPFWRDKVQGNITAGSLRGAQAVVTELRANQLPPCATGAAPGTPPTCVAATQ
jgi:protein phosphatase